MKNQNFEFRQKTIKVFLIYLFKAMINTRGSASAYKQVKPIYKIFRKYIIPPFPPKQKPLL